MLTDLFLTINHMRYHAIDWGRPQGAQPILLAHGLASNAKIWNFVAPGLAEHFRVIAIDQRSHGLTDPPPDGDYSFNAMCSDLHALCAELQFARPIIVGHSWGASVALEYAARYPSETAGIIMVDGGFAGMGQRMTWEETEQRLAPPRLAGTPLAAFRERAKGFMGDLYTDERFEAMLGNFEVRADGTIAPHLAFENHMKIVRAMWEQDPTVLYSSITCPALFLPCVPSEPHDDTTVEMLKWKRSSAQMISELMPHAKFDWLTDSIHDVPVQKPQLVIEKISSFANNL
jgi:pimeloyl-ACP methyl ester carboxylesterase